MGFYDNNQGCFIDIPEMKNGIWLIHEETGELYILAKDGDPTFDTRGADDERIDEIHQIIKDNDLTDNDLQNDDIMSEHGYQYCWEWQRRFSSESGYFYA